MWSLPAVTKSYAVSSSSQTLLQLKSRPVENSRRHRKIICSRRAWIKFLWKRIRRYVLIYVSLKFALLACFESNNALSRDVSLVKILLINAVRILILASTLRYLCGEEFLKSCQVVRTASLWMLREYKKSCEALVKRCSAWQSAIVNSPWAIFNYHAHGNWKNYHWLSWRIWTSLRKW